MVRIRTLAALLFFCSFSVVAGTTPTIDQLLSLKSVSRPRIAPDGHAVVYEVTSADWNENAYVTQLWLADVRGGRTMQLTRGKKSSDDAQWSPDGRWIAFLGEREMPSSDKKDGDAKPDARQIWVISPDGGEPWMLTRHAAKIDSFAWSRDGKRIAFTAPEPQTKAQKDRKEKYSDYVVFEGDYEQHQLWSVDVRDGVAAGAARITSDPKLDVTGFDWSPDGSRIAFSAAANPLLAYRSTNDIYVVDLQHGNAVHRVVAFDGPDSDPKFSPDGRSIAFTTSLGQPYFYYANDRIATVALDGTSPVDVITAGFDEDASLVDWKDDGIHFTALQKTSSHLFRADPRTKAIVRLTSPDDFALGGVSLSDDGRTMAWTAATATAVAEVFAGTFAAPRKLTDMNAQLEPFTLGTVELVSWRSRDGATIEGVLHKPANYDGSKKYPLFVVIHGGPTGVSRPLRNPGGRYYPVELFLARGALVLEPNYRGSAGYGEKFRALNVRNLGVGDMWDVMSGADALIAKGMVDPAKLGAMGWSQGGYISAFLTTNTDRFKAISVGAGISDWTTYYVNTDITPFTRQYLHAAPWDDPLVYAKTSPITNIRNARTPTLIQHGDADKRVPPPNAFELYRGLRDVGVPVKLILYNGFGHPITKPKSNRAVLQHNLDWFDHYIWGDPIPPDSPLRGSGSGQ